MQVIPGVSDHDCVLIDTTKPWGKSHCIKKAQWEELEEHMSQAGEEIKEQANTSADTLWELSSNALQEGVMKFIPYKTCKAQDNLPHA